MIIQLRNYLRSKVDANKKELSMMPRNYSDKGHLLKLQRGKPEDLLDDTHIPSCIKCKQPNLSAHSYYYRDVHSDSKTKGNYYEMCMTCAYCETGML